MGTVSGARPGCATLTTATCVSARKASRSALFMANDMCDLPSSMIVDYCFAARGSSLLLASAASADYPDTGARDVDGCLHAEPRRSLQLRSMDSRQPGSGPVRRCR